MSYAVLDEVPSSKEYMNRMALHRRLMPNYKISIFQEILLVYRISSVKLHLLFKQDLQAIRDL